MVGGRNHLFLHQKQLTALVMDPVMGDSGWLPKPRHGTAMPCSAWLGSEQPHCVGLEQTSVLPNPTCIQVLLNHSSCVMAAMAWGSVGIRGVMGGYGV